MIFNMVGGGGEKLFSIIAVTYPEGGVCTCSNGAKTLKAKDTSGKALFNVDIGEWTVTATDGDKTKSVTVSITAEGQNKSVTLNYSFVILRDGEYVDTSFVMLEGSSDDGPRDDGTGRAFYHIYTEYGALIMRTAKKIPAYIKTLKIVGRMVDGTFGPGIYNTFFVSESNSWPDAYTNNKLASLSPFTSLNNNNAEYSFDISQINKDVYLWYAGSCGVSGRPVAIVIDDLEGVIA